MANDFGYPELAKKSESYEICFVPDNDYRGFLKHRVEGLEEKVNGGWFVDKHGLKLGQHKGYPFYTIGQRKGLNLGGHARPLFVLGTDPDKNIIYTGMGEDHPGLYRHGLFIPAADQHWVREDQKLSSGESRKYRGRIRYRQPLADCVLHQKDEGLYIIFDQPQKSITPGQFAAWYNGEELVGSGVIS